MLVSRPTTGGVLVTLSVLLALSALPAGAQRGDSPSPGAPSPQGILYDRALSEYRSGRFPQALALLEKGTRDFPGDAGLTTLLGWTRLHLSDVAGARRAFEAALRANPKSSDARAGLGYAALRQRRMAEAEANFLKAVRLDPRNGEAWKGLGIARRDREDRKGAHEALQQAISLDPRDAEARGLLEQVAGPGGVLEERRVRGKEPEGKPLALVSRTGAARLEVLDGKEFRPFFIKGVNLGTALPGKFPAEFPDDPDLYRRWFDQMGDLGMNVVRLYTLHPPSLYRALQEHNEKRPDRRLFLVQGVWTELPENDDYDDPAFLDPFRDEIRRVIDAIHGNVEVPVRPGHAGGVYDADVSGDLLAILLGREWEPYSVVAYEKLKPGRAPYAGEYVKATGEASPFESWLASICDLAARHETEQYRMQHPVGYVSWPTLDPLSHPTEATAAEETEIRKRRGEKLSEPIREYDNDAVGVDAMHIAATPKFPAGFFASYHAYPYYPEFMMLDPGYGKARDAEGPSHYFGYLSDLKAHHKDQPVIIAEFGVPTSRGIAHLQPEGQHHGGHNSVEQGKIDARLFRDIHDAGLAGGILFAWMDEWFKRNWLVMNYEVPPERNPLWLNPLDPEQNYGLLAAWPGRPGWKVVLDGQGGDWAAVRPLYIDDTAPGKGDGPGGFRHLRGFRVTSDEAYLYLRLDLDPGGGPPDWDRTRYWIGIDTYEADRGDHRFPRPVDVTTPAGMEFLVQLRRGAQPDPGQPPLRSLHQPQRSSLPLRGGARRRLHRDPGLHQPRPLRPGRDLLPAPGLQPEPPPARIHGSRLPRLRHPGRLDREPRRRIHRGPDRLGAAQRDRPLVPPGGPRGRRAHRAGGHARDRRVPLPSPVAEGGGGLPHGGGSLPPGGAAVPLRFPGLPVVRLGGAPLPPDPEGQLRNSQGGAPSHPGV